MGRDGRRTGARLVSCVLVLCWCLAGCTYSAQEPGLFGRGPDPSVGPSSRGDDRAGIRRGNPDLPVVGEAEWISGDGLEVQVRIAVHAVRRIAGGTVLDWSVTPLGGPGLAPGDPVPPSLNLGLSRSSEGSVNVFLVDPDAGAVYRPVTERTSSGVDTCLCSPVWVAQRQLQIGVTRLLQITYPTLPADLAAIDVDIATVPLFWHVPVTAPGLVPQATSSTDLSRNAKTSSIGRSTPVFSYPNGRQRFVISVDQVLVSRSFTSVRWSIRSVTAGNGLRLATEPPFTDPDLDPVTGYDPTSASGPQVVVSGGKAAKALHARLMTSRLRGLSGLECLCSELGLWADALTAPRQQVSVVTNLAALPRDVELVDVILPRVATLRGIPVTQALDGMLRSAGAMARPTGTWSYVADHPPLGWSVDQWPTPLPSSRQLKSHHATVDTLVR